MDILIFLFLMAVAVWVVGSIFVAPFLILPPVILGPILDWIARVELRILGIEPVTLTTEKGWGRPTGTRNNVGIVVFLNGLVPGSILSIYGYIRDSVQPYPLDLHWRILGLLSGPMWGLIAWICWAVGTELWDNWKERWEERKKRKEQEREARKNLRK